MLHIQVFTPDIVPAKKTHTNARDNKNILVNRLKKICSSGEPEALLKIRNI
jgi:hypothetical protein